MTKTPLANPKLLGSHAEDTVFSLKEHSRHVLFCGTRVIQTRFYDKQKVRAVVLRTGQWLVVSRQFDKCLSGHQLVQSWKLIGSNTIDYLELLLPINFF